MKVTFENPGYVYSLESLVETMGLGEFWSQPIFYFYLDLRAFRGLGEAGGDRDRLVQELGPRVLRLYQDQEEEMNAKVLSYQALWDQEEDLINDYFTSAFSIHTREIFNDLLCRLSLNPICPRYLKERAFDTFSLGRPDQALANALHEICHFLWFDLWHASYGDSYEDYEAPSLIWLLSEAVVEELLKDERMDALNCFHKSGRAYAYFYSMKVQGRPLYSYLDQWYGQYSIGDFMEKAYDLFLAHEEEIRSQVP